MGATQEMIQAGWHGDGLRCDVDEEDIDAVYSAIWDAMSAHGTPEEPTPEMVAAAIEADPYKLNNMSAEDVAEHYAEIYRMMRSAAPSLSP